MTIRVVMADDHSLVRRGLHDYLKTADDIEVVGEGTTGAEAVDLVERTKPDVAILDIRMPDMDGLEATRTIVERFPDVRVVMLTAHDERHFVVEAVEAGARGYVLKSRDADHMVQTVRLVAQGNLVIDPQVVAALAEELTGPRTKGRPSEPLTEREVEILQLLSFGHTNRDIGEKLFISPDTVKTHLEHIYQKLGATDRTAAVASALRRRLIE